MNAGNESVDQPRQGGERHGHEYSIGPRADQSHLNTQRDHRMLLPGPSRVCSSRNAQESWHYNSSSQEYPQQQPGSYQAGIYNGLPSMNAYSSHVHQQQPQQHSQGQENPIITGRQAGQSVFFSGEVENPWSTINFGGQPPATRPDDAMLQNLIHQMDEQRAETCLLKQHFEEFRFYVNRQLLSQQNRTDPRSPRTPTGSGGKRRAGVVETPRGSGYKRPRGVKAEAPTEDQK